MNRLGLKIKTLELFEGFLSTKPLMTKTKFAAAKQKQGCILIKSTIRNTIKFLILYECYAC